MGISISPNNASLECMAERRTNLKSKPEFPHLFQPCKIGQMILTNRVVLPAMGNNYGTEDGSVTDRQIDYYNERAIGGAGLLITGLIPVSFGIDPTVSEDSDTTYFPRIDGSSRTRLSGFRDLAAGGYYTTPEGMKDLSYTGNVALSAFAGPPPEVLKALGLTPT